MGSYQNSPNTITCCVVVLICINIVWKTFGHTGSGGAALAMPTTTANIIKTVRTDIYQLTTTTNVCESMMERNRINVHTKKEMEMEINKKKMRLR
jgi:hypothetical protein